MPCSTSALWVRYVSSEVRRNHCDCGDSAQSKRTEPMIVAERDGNSGGNGDGRHAGDQAFRGDLRSARRIAAMLAGL